MGLEADGGEAWEWIRKTGEGQPPVPEGIFFYRKVGEPLVKVISNHQQQYTFNLSDVMSDDHDAPAEAASAENMAKAVAQRAVDQLLEVGRPPCIRVMHGLMCHAPRPIRRSSSRAARRARRRGRGSCTVSRKGSGGRVCAATCTILCAAAGRAGASS